MIWDARKFVAFDLETYLIEVGLLAPPIVCASVAGPWTFGGALVVGLPAVLELARSLLESDLVIVGANIAYDFGCLAVADPTLLPLIFKAYEEHRVFDILIGQALHAIFEGNHGLDPRTGDKLADPVTGERKGRYSLAITTDLVLRRVDAKIHDRLRTSYALLEGVPLEQWPSEAQQYPVDDAVNTLEVSYAQVVGGGAGVTPGPHRNLDDLPQQAETAYAMHLGAIWGLRTDPAKVDKLRASALAAHDAFIKEMHRLGFYRFDEVEKEWKKDQRAVKRAVVVAYGGQGPCLEPGCRGGKVISPKTGNPKNCPTCSGTGLDVSRAPKTPTGGVCADRDVLENSGDDDLEALGENKQEKTLNTYLPKLADESLGRWLRPNVLVSSGRTSYEGVIQLMPRLGGERECFAARPGWYFCSVDYAAGELCTLGQICLWLFGESQLAYTINATGDPGALHTVFAAALVGSTPEEMAVRIAAGEEDAKKKRTVAKFLNYSLGGGSGAPKIVQIARKENAGDTTLPNGVKVPGIRFCVLLEGAERCGVQKITEWKHRQITPTCKRCVGLVDSELRPMWFRQWPEVPHYFSWVTSKVEAGGEFPCFLTDRVRGGLEFTNGANNGFQALLADGAKAALRAVTRECYLDRSSALWGTRPIFFAHDEIFAEMPAERAHLAGPRMAEVMVETLRAYVPDVTVVALPSLMRWWTKKAGDPCYDASGKLIPYEDAQLLAKPALKVAA